MSQDFSELGMKSLFTHQRTLNPALLHQEHQRRQREFRWQNENKKNTWKSRDSKTVSRNPNKKPHGSWKPREVLPSTDARECVFWLHMDGLYLWTLPALKIHSCKGSLSRSLKFWWVVFTFTVKKPCQTIPRLPKLPTEVPTTSTKV